MATWRSARTWPRRPSGRPGASAAALQPDRLRPWLCGIARNLGKNAYSKAARAAGPATALDLNVAAELATDEPGPAEDAVSREEESLVWETLEQIPEAYREPLILFYREDQSVAEVAAALELSEEAVRQRLSRGRGMLRERVAGLVESGLRRTRPGRGFTVAVMAGLTTHSAGAKAAMAGAAAAGAAKGAGGVGLAGGLLGGLGGSLVGLFGGWLGSWLPAQVARTKVERDLLLRNGRRLLLASIVFAAGVFGLVETLSRRSPAAYLIALGTWHVLFMAYVAFESIRTVRKVRSVLAESGVVHEPNDTVMSVGVNAIAARFRGRVFRSRSQFLGYPLVDINVSDPRPPNGPGDPSAGGRVARGWIALGDDARGIVLGVGSKARGFVAIGGRAIGVIEYRRGRGWPRRLRRARLGGRRNGRPRPGRLRSRGSRGRLASVRGRGGRLGRRVWRWCGRLARGHRRGGDRSRVCRRRRSVGPARQR